jgi:hypothetical protein
LLRREAAVDWNRGWLELHTVANVDVNGALVSRGVDTSTFIIINTPASVLKSHDSPGASVFGNPMNLNTVPPHSPMPLFTEVRKKPDHL